MRINNHMSPKEYIRENIEKKVFIRHAQEAIVDAFGAPAEWLFDFRRVTLQPKFLDAFAEIFFERLGSEYPFQVGGIEVASIPLMSAIVMKSVERGMPISGFFIRKSRKKQGLLRMVEGEISGEKIILVDDLMNTGSSIIRQAEVIEGLGKKVEAVFVVLRFRNEEYYEELAKRGIRIVSLFSLSDFTGSLGVKNLLERENMQVPMPFEAEWVFRGEHPNFFYVVPKSAPLLDDMHVYVGSDDGDFLAIDRRSGRLSWKYKVPFGAQGKYIFSSPARWNEFVFFGAYDGNFYALNRHTGKREWVFMEADWVGSSPAVANDLELVYVGLEFGLINKKGGVVALNTKNGKKVWEYQMGGLTHASPAYSQKFNTVVCGCNDGTFTALNAKTGALRWVVQAGASSRYGASFHEKEGLVFFGAEDGKLYAVNITTGEITFTFNVEFGMYSTPLVHGDCVYAAGLDKNVYCVSVRTGKELWRFPTKGRIYASPILFRGNIYIGSNDGRLYELDPLTGKNTALFQATERITNRIAGDDKTGEIFLPTFANEIYCLVKK